MKLEVYTIGHSTRSLGELIHILDEFGIEAVVDVRRFPRSRKFPHFNGENLKEALEKRGIDYLWLGDTLGGMRRARKYKGQPWGGYREHMETEEFKKGIEELIKTALKKKTAILCAEKLYFRCHRLLISEKLVEMGARVIHIIDPGRTYEHRLREKGTSLFPDHEPQSKLHEGGSETL